MSFKIGNNYKNLPKDETPSPIGGEICITGVTRSGGPGSGSIIGVDLEIMNPSPRWTLTNVTMSFFAGLGDFYTKTVTDATFNNVTSYLLEYTVNFTNPTTRPTVVASPSLNPTGTDVAIVNQILATHIDVTPESIHFAYAVVVFGASQEDSDNLIETIFTPTPAKSCLNFIALF